MLELGWARRVKDTRIVQFTPPGERAFQAAFAATPEPARQVADATAAL